MASAVFKGLRLGVAVVLSGTALASFNAHAAPVPGSQAADPSRVDAQINTPTKRFNSLRQDSAKKQETSGIITPPEGADTVHFTLHGLHVSGMDAYTAEDIKSYYSPWLDKDITLAKLYQIASAIQQRYLDDGFSLTKIIVPDQDFSDGHVELVAIEGHATQVEVDPQLRSSAALSDAVEQVQQMRPLNLMTLERILLILNDLPDMHVSVILATPKDPTPQDLEPGAVRVIFKKNEDKQTFARISIDDYGSVFTGPWQATANAHLYHLGVDHADLSATLSGTDPLSEQRYGMLNYTVPLFGVSGTKLSVGAVWAKTEPGDNLEPLRIEGETHNFNFTLSYPIIRQRAKSWSVDGGFEVKNAKTDLLGGELYDDRMRIISLGTNFSVSDSWDGFNAMDLHFVKGLDLFGATDGNSTSRSRADGEPAFTKFEGFIGRVQALPHDFEIYTLISGQYSFDPLLSSEEFGFGGGQTGRGYDPSEITGDRGVAGTLEVRYNADWTPMEVPVGLQPYAFYDAGKVWNIDAGNMTDVFASSAGGGLRLNVDNSWDINLATAFPLTKRADNPPDYTNATGVRYLFSISRSF